MSFANLQDLHSPTLLVFGFQLNVSPEDGKRKENIEGLDRRCGGDIDAKFGSASERRG